MLDIIKKLHQEGQLSIFKIGRKYTFRFLHYTNGDFGAIPYFTLVALITLLPPYFNIFLKIKVVFIFLTHLWVYNTAGLILNSYLTLQGDLQVALTLYGPALIPFYYPMRQN